jgi:iron complex outermembrane receptor protein
MPRFLPPTIVLGESAFLPSSEGVGPVFSEQLRTRDASQFLDEMPGAAVVRNGPLTGMPQLRGLGGDRVRVLVDGMTITPACPNHMDPPLHYAAPNNVSTLTVLAGITPVSQGGDSIGGTVRADPLPPQFSTNDLPLFSGNVGAFYSSDSDARGAQAGAGVANRDLSVRYDGSLEKSDDLRFPGGRVADTSYETQRHALLSGVRTGKGVLSLDGGATQTRDAGTPALPMDMIEDDSYRIGLQHRGDYDFGSVAGRFYYHDIQHLMDNFSLRPLTPGAMPMEAPGESTDMGFALDGSIPRNGHAFSLGSGFHQNDFEAYQRNLTTLRTQDMFNNASRTRIGTYAEWQADWSSEWTTLLGARNDTVLSEAGGIDSHFPLPAIAADRAAFNAADRTFTDVDFDATAAVRFTPAVFATFELAGARKTRAPSLVERYIWTPLSASAGQADGRTYLGNLDLDPEVSHQISGSVDFHGPRWQVKATPFYNYVTDYIQGRPINRNAAGQPVLQFQNLNAAELYGIEGSARYDLTSQFTVRAIASYVRGFNLEDDDYLYRIAPLRGSINLDHHWKALKSNLELELVSSQDDVAQYNDELKTDGYALLHFRVQYTILKHLTLEVAVENLTNELYQDHLGGVNRVLDSDVPVGERIPGAGRFAYVGASVSF